MKPGYKQRRRLTLFEKQNGLCFWCAEPMVLPESYPAEGSQHSRLCTIDHLRDRFDPARWAPALPGEERTVAACYDCNNRRGKLRYREFMSQQDPVGAQKRLDWIKNSIGVLA